MTEQEKYVREHWELVHCCDGSYRLYARGTVLLLLQYANSRWYDFPSWPLAYDFVVQRLESIRQVEREIEWLRWKIKLMPEQGYADSAVSLINRILAREQSALAELRRGLKEDR